MKKTSSTASSGPATKNEVRKAILDRNKMQSGKKALAAIPWKAMHESTQTALRHLLSGQQTLKERYKAHLQKSPKSSRNHEMTFALDGRLVGDIGELIAAEVFRLDLLGTKSRNVDAVTTGKPVRRVQIKATFKDDGLGIKHGRDYFIGLQLKTDGRYRIVYNGPAKPVMDYLRLPKARGHSGRAEAGSRLEPITLEAWAVLDLAVAPEDRVPFRRL